MPLSLMPPRVEYSKPGSARERVRWHHSDRILLKSFTFIDREIELELVTSPSRRIRPGSVHDRCTVLAELKLATYFGQYGRSALEETRQLLERDWSLIIEVARRMTLTQKSSERDCLRLHSGELA